LKEVRIVGVDDSPLIREYIEHAFAKVEGCNVIGMARDGNEAVIMIRALRPTVVILDISMPHKNGIEVLREIREEAPCMVIIMFTADPSVLLEQICLKEGANYYISKTQFLDLIEICKELQAA
jgi:DNA-binding NarL/FixJ family response regulator